MQPRHPQIKEKYWAWFSFGASYLISDRDMNN